VEELQSSRNCPSGDVIKTPIPNPFSPTKERDAQENMRREAEFYEKIGQHE
jgi:hypothetical protein